MILVVAVGQLGAQVQLHLAAVTQGHGTQGVLRFEMLVGIGQPAHLPATEGGQRQGQQTDGSGYGQRPPTRARCPVRDVRHVFRARQVLGHLPDLQHRFILERMQRVGSTPLLERLTLGAGAVIGVQAHAPMRGGVGDGVEFCLREGLFAH
ncbi:hypothetical protein D3C84_640910 [compost metagenome]